MIKNATSMVLGISLLAVSSVAVAQSRSQIVARPAVMATPTLVAQAGIRSPNPTQGIIIVVPAPLPPLPPNFCNRGNSGGVSRC